ncbi:hypothetical protein PoB_003753100 [Plakobranchus ocellatus]|uniref:Uncharacterized protein n=1 Tax=Plakobranchus ocellatus TaxID=259542 RepID=A0AAV4AWY0_9GAST|nr:hypothetical protein PoB_003753100 [Plakobranchus ocellatus]
MRLGCPKRARTENPIDIEIMADPSTVASESALKSAGTLLSWVRAPPPSPGLTEGLKARDHLVMDRLYTKTNHIALNSITSAPFLEHLSSVVEILLVRRFRKLTDERAPKELMETLNF